MQTKIRAWDGEMFYFVDLEKNLNPLNPDYKKLYNDYLSVFWQLEAKEQSTGLIVGNGELFEGDIVRIDNKHYSVNFRETSFYLSEDLHGTHVAFHLFTNWDLVSKIQIVGNIYENSDLLS